MLVTLNILNLSTNAFIQYATSFYYVCAFLFFFFFYLVVLFVIILFIFSYDESPMSKNA